MQIFGFEITKKKEEQIPSIVQPTSDDGSINISSNTAAYYTHVVDMDTNIKNENQLIARYRDISLYPEVDEAINEIVNEAITYSEDGKIVKLDLSELKVSDSLKKRIIEEFEEVQNLLDFKENAYEIFRRWYIDGRIYYLINIDLQNSKKGIQKLELIDSRKIRKVRKIEKDRDPKTGLEVIKNVEEFFMYNEKGIESSSAQGIKLSLDSVVYVPSGIIDTNSNIVLSYLHKAIKPANQLKMMEDAVVIYRISRAPERRIFYIDVGNLPKIKAEQYVTDIMNKYKSKIVYDATTGEVRDDRKFMSMLEDFWMPRREGGKGTEITTLPGGQNLGQMEDVDYFKQKLYRSLNVPLARLLPQDNFSLGRSNEVTRDELKFMKFIDRLRKKFNKLLLDCLRVQLVAKNIISPEDWDELRKFINLKYTVDNNFTELKEAELLQNRLAILQVVDGYIGKWLSPQWVQRNVLKFTDEEVQQIEKEINDMDERFLSPEKQALLAQQQADEDQSQQEEQPEEQSKKESLEVPVSPINTLIEKQKTITEIELLETVTNYLKK